MAVDDEGCIAGDVKPEIELHKQADARRGLNDRRQSGDASAVP